MISSIGRVAMLAVSLCAAVFTAAPASADDTDDIYLKALEAGGIVIKEPDSAVAMGKTVCAGFDKQAPFPLLVQTLMMNAGLSPTEAGHVIGVSVAAYCPEYKPLLDQFG